MIFLQAGGKSIVLDANATSQLRNQGLASTDDSPKFQHEVRLFSCGVAISYFYRVQFISLFSACLGLRGFKYNFIGFHSNWYLKTHHLQNTFK